MKTIISILFLILSISLHAQVASWEFEEKRVISAKDINSSPEDFRILGDSRDYLFYYQQTNTGASGNMRFTINNDTGTNYRYYEMTGSVTTPGASVTDTAVEVFIALCQNATNYSTAGIIEITGSSGDERAIDCLFSYLTNVPASGGRMRKAISFWQNTADEATSLQVYSSTTTPVTADIWLFSRPKTGVYNAEDWEVVERYDFSAVNLNSSPKIFLTQGNDEEYLIVSDFSPVATSALTLTVNDDTGANYTRQRLINSAGSLSADTVTTATGVNMCYVTAGNLGTSRVLIKAKTGQYRPILATEKTNDQRLFEQQYFWRNSADQINKFTCTGSVSTNSTGTITLLKRSRARSSISAHEQLIEEYEIGQDPWSANNTTLSSYDSGLPSAWQFTNGSLLVDSVGPATLVNSGGVTNVSGGKDGYGANFASASSQYLYNTAQASTIDSDDGSYAVSMWVKFTTIPQSGSGALPTLFYLSGGDGLNLIVYVDNVTDSGLSFRIDETDGTNIRIDQGADWNPSTSVFQHVVAIADKTSGKIHLYLNNSEIGTGTAYDGTIRANSTQLTLGWQDDADSDWLLNGVLDEAYPFTTVSFADTAEREAFVDGLYNSDTGAFKQSESVDFSSGHIFQNIPPSGALKFVIEAIAESTAEDMHIQINGDSGSSYAYQYLAGSSTATSAATTTTTSLGQMKIDEVYPLLTELLIFPATGKYRPILQTIGDYTTTTRIKLMGSWWLNTADSIHSIKVYTASSDPITGTIKLYHIPKIK